MDRLTKQQMEFMNGYVPANIHDVYEYAAGGGIHIKPSHEGRFTAYKERTGKTTEEALHSPDPHVRQMANFARNAAKWKHQDGGAAGGEQEQVMQVIQAYAEAKGIDPKALIEQLQKLQPEEQQAQIKAMYKAVAGNQMQEGGPIPQEQGAPQQQGPDPQQILQAVQDMLKQGAKPEEVIAQLLEAQIDPQMIMQVFAELGMPEEEIMQTIESLTQQEQPQEGQYQEEENPQEQMQEEGYSEEPQGPPMAYGGTPQFVRGGYNNYYPQYDNYRAPGVVDNTRFNSGMLGVNAMMDPTVSALPAALAAAPNNPLSAILNIGVGAASGLAGSLAGYKGLFHNKNNEQNKQFLSDANKQAPNLSSNLNLQKPDAYKAIGKMFNKTPDPFKSKYDNWKPGQTNTAAPNNVSAPNPNNYQPQFNTNNNWDAYDPNRPISGASMNNLYGAPVMDIKKKGGLTKAQFGRDWSAFGKMLNLEDPNKTNALVNDPRFGQTANYADSPGYGQQSTKGYNVLEYDPNDVNVNTAGKTNNKVLNTKYMSGPGIATNALSGLGAVNSGLAYFENRERDKQYARDQRRNTKTLNRFPVYNNPNPYGDWTVNSGKLKPNMYVPTQDIGTSQYAKYGGSARYANGGQTQYQQGGEYHVTQDELVQLMQNGAEVEFL